LSSIGGLEYLISTPSNCCFYLPLVEEEIEEKIENNN
jgi:hypothetical protein